MTFLVKSSGILARAPIISTCLEQPVARFGEHPVDFCHDICIGWGLKANSRQFKAQAQGLGVPFWQLEDGFIGYIGHPAAKGRQVSLVADKQGMYYDANHHSDLEQCIATPCSEIELARAEALVAAVVDAGITKYNCYPQANSHQTLPSSLKAMLNGREYVLLVDQVAGDQSVAGALASDDDFIAMVRAAKSRYPDACLLVRTHPDTIFSRGVGKKVGALVKLEQHPELANVLWFSQACHPHALIQACAAVFTVSSQMGFEALLYQKPVHCFGMPFYAGWGLTHDSKTCPRRQLLASAHSVSLYQLAHAALIAYPKYYHPVLAKACEPEEIIELIVLQARALPQYQQLYLVGFSFWKRAFMGAFCGELAQTIRFVAKPPSSLQANEQMLVWGNQWPELTDVIRVEDGFIRSSGLGSDLRRPSSLVVDDLGMYFNAKRNNRLRELLNYQPLTEAMAVRGAHLAASLVANDITKYNLASKVAFQAPNTNKPVLLVVGQVDGDASLTTGSPFVHSNQSLLHAVRKANPEAYIIYKPHPDVVAGNREGLLSDACRRDCVDEEITEIGLNQLYPVIDALHTMTSLSGFEALLRGVKVVTWGQPFYGGWGLTQDMHPPHDRLRPLSLEHLIYITLVAYPKYVDWDTGLKATPEQLIIKMAHAKADANLKSTSWQRWQRKLTYLMETLRT
ncbi:capsular polysaccharide biosynthesis protein [Shewanella sp. NIFS-20-20]|uniref:capsular polysaccharide biosynthesis protein n=1 Tax=Shewanella sp. NIFS-20-20 TaxID=2853806 RepID=UPI001C4523E6|nr:capsular polysaccharide biosynthesis protein [Shewanella sp. NIFS-20-20]MBV7316271.1 capsular polysaccharide biosynthesis protein [Shewanella sp. NIFS-20-20]